MKSGHNENSKNAEAQPKKTMKLNLESLFVVVAFTWTEAYDVRTLPDVVFLSLSLFSDAIFS